MAGGICGGTNAVLDRIYSSSTAHSNRPALVQPVYAEEELTLEQITKEMQEKTVEEILKGKAEWLNSDNLLNKTNEYKSSVLFVYGSENMEVYRRTA